MGRMLSFFLCLLTVAVANYGSIYGGLGTWGGGYGVGLGYGGGYGGGLGYGGGYGVNQGEAHQILRICALEPTICQLFPDRDCDSDGMKWSSPKVPCATPVVNPLVYLIAQMSH